MCFAFVSHWRLELVENRRWTQECIQTMWSLVMTCWNWSHPSRYYTECCQKDHFPVTLLAFCLVVLCSVSLELKFWYIKFTCPPVFTGWARESPELLFFSLLKLKGHSIQIQLISGLWESVQEGKMWSWVIKKCYKGLFLLPLLTLSLPTKSVLICLLIFSGVEEWKTQQFFKNLTSDLCFTLNQFWATAINTQAGLQIDMPPYYRWKFFLWSSLCSWGGWFQVLNVHFLCSRDSLRAAAWSSLWWLPAHTSYTKWNSTSILLPWASVSWMPEKQAEKQIWKEYPISWGKL